MTLKMHTKAPAATQGDASNHFGRSPRAKAYNDVHTRRTQTQEATRLVCSFGMNTDTHTHTHARHKHKDLKTFAYFYKSFTRIISV